MSVKVACPHCNRTLIVVPDSPGVQCACGAVVRPTALKKTAGGSDEAPIDGGTLNAICPKCRHKMRLPTSARGTKVPCTGCSAVITIPAAPINGGASTRKPSSGLGKKIVLGCLAVVALMFLTCTGGVSLLVWKFGTFDMKWGDGLNGLPGGLVKTADPARERLVGKWQNVNPNEKGILEFRQDGSVALLAGNITLAKGTYELKGPELLLSMNLGGKDVVRTVKAKIGKDELETTDTANKVEKFRRFTGQVTPPVVVVKPPPPSAPTLRQRIVGRWRNVEPKEGTVEFRDDGSVRSEAGGKSLTGRYVFVNDRMLELSFRVGDVEVKKTITARINDRDELTTTDQADNRVDRFRRDDGTAPPVVPPTPRLVQATVALVAPGHDRLVLATEEGGKESFHVLRPRSATIRLIRAERPSTLEDFRVGERVELRLSEEGARPVEVRLLAPGSP